MLTARLLLLVLIGQTTESPSDPAALVEKLGSARYAEREAAKALENFGSKALPALRAALKSKDPEVRTRARALINKIEGNLLTQETLVRLDFNDVTPEEIAKSLSQQAGFEVRLSFQGPQAGKRVTLRDSKPVPFWSAIDRLCESAQLTCQPQNSFMPGQAGAPWGLNLSYQFDPLTPPTCHHGPFRISVVNLSYQSNINFHMSAQTMLAQMRAGARGMDLALRKDAGRPLEPTHTGARGPAAQADGEKRGKAPARSVQFAAHLQIVPEPRMALSSVGSLELLEAIDDLGNSLLPASRGEETALGRRGMTGPMDMMAFSMPATFMAHVTAELHRPDTPGQVIKKLRGTVEVSVSARRSNPLVIPLEGAAGKTFQNDEFHIVVNSLGTDQVSRQDLIELAIENLDEHFPDESANGLAPGMRPGVFGRAAPLFRLNASHWPIQVVDSTGQNVFFQATVDRDSGRVTLHMPPRPGMAQAKEIRVSSLVRATVKIPFEFTNLPMP
jgi:hypothetical protein